MENQNKNSITINKIPSITWNWLKINGEKLFFEDEKFNAEKNIKTKIPEGVKKIKNEEFKTSLLEPNSSCGFEFDKIIDSSSEPEIFEISKETDSPVIFEINSESKNSCISHVIHAKENSSVKIIYVYSGKEKGVQLIRTKVFAEKNSKVHIVKVQLLDKNFIHADDLQSVCGENAKLKYTRIDLGAFRAINGIHTTLFGKNSSFKSNAAYLAQKNQNYDMNHVVFHCGKSSECQMNVSGTLKDNASKTYRGTIDFKNGCSLSKGNEMEETLLLSPDVVNKSLPVILCDEENVEGEHGCTIGRLSSEILFYMQTRGFSKEDAEKITAKAKINSCAGEINHEETQNKIKEFLNEISGGKNEKSELFS